MKKLIVILLLIIYAGSALGITINYHYCCGTLVNVSVLNVEGKAGCSCDSRKMSKDCCKDTILTQKVDKHKPGHSASILHYTPLAVALPISVSQQVTLFMDGYSSDNISEFVPRSCSEPIYLLNRVFRI